MHVGVCVIEPAHYIVYHVVKYAAYVTRRFLRQCGEIWKKIMKALLETLKWWFCWPWIKYKNRTKYDIGISVATAILYNGGTITITRYGKSLGSGWTLDSESRMDRTMDQKWIYADDKNYYDRDNVVQWSVDTKSYWVYEDNSPVEE